MEKELDIGGFVDEYILDIPENCLPFAGEFTVCGDYKILSFEKKWNKIHLLIYFSKTNQEYCHIIKFFIMDRKGDVPKEYSYVCSGQDIGAFVGKKHKMMHLFTKGRNLA